MESSTRITLMLATVLACGVCACDAFAPDLEGWEVRYPPNISLSPQSLEFAAVQGGADPDSQIVSVKNVGGEPLTGLAASVAYGQSQPSGWLSAVLRSTTAPTSIVVRATAGALPPDSLSATIIVRSSVDGVSRRAVKILFVISGSE